MKKNIDVDKNNFRVKDIFEFFERWKTVVFIFSYKYFYFYLIKVFLYKIPKVENCSLES